MTDPERITAEEYLAHAPATKRKKDRRVDPGPFRFRCAVCGERFVSSYDRGVRHVNAHGGGRLECDIDTGP